MVVNCRSCGSAMITNKTSYSWLCPDCIKYILKLDITTNAIIEELERRASHPFISAMVSIIKKWNEEEVI